MITYPDKNSGERLSMRQDVALECKDLRIWSSSVPLPT